MEIHDIGTMTVLSRTRRLNVSQIGEEAALVYGELHAEAAARGLAVNGPAVFVARSMPQDAHTLFEIDFCLPVAGDDLPTLPPLRCARLIYEGPLANLFVQGYQTLLQSMADKGLTPNGESREVYHVWYGPESDDNRIEVQIGVASSTDDNAQ